VGNYRYAVATDSRDGQTLAVLEDAEGGRRLQAALHGGVVFGFSVTVNAARAAAAMDSCAMPTSN